MILSLAHLGSIGAPRLLLHRNLHVLFMHTINDEIFHVLAMILFLCPLAIPKFFHQALRLTGGRILRPGAYGSSD